MRILYNNKFKKAYFSRNMNYQIYYLVYHDITILLQLLYYHFLIYNIIAYIVLILKPSEYAIECSNFVKYVIDRVYQKYFRYTKGYKKIFCFQNKILLDHILFTYSSRSSTFICKDGPFN